MTQFQIIGVDMCRYVEKNTRCFKYIMVMSSIKKERGLQCVRSGRSFVMVESRFLTVFLKHRMALWKRSAGRRNRKVRVDVKVHHANSHENCLCATG